MISPGAISRVAQKGYLKPAPRSHTDSRPEPYHWSVQRLFSMFPAGLPGVALFLLRISVIGMLADSTLQNPITGNISLWKLLIPVLIGLMLLCGAFTPIACAFSLTFEAISWPAWDELRTLEFLLPALVMIALFLLGPGAYSIDSRMFGRRLILPPQ